MNPPWEAQMRGRRTTLAGPGGEALLGKLAESGALPFAATEYWLSLARKARANPADQAFGPTHAPPPDPILAQAIPSIREFESAPGDEPDPLGESGHSPCPGIVHQYPSRILIRASGECPVFCRYCFRRSLLPAERGFLDKGSLDAMEAYLGTHQEVREALVSGGDPLCASDDRLADLFRRLRKARPGIMIRLCTRAPATLPDRITPSLVEMLRSYRPMRVVVHVNHPLELSPEFAAASGRIIDAGIPTRSQTVLLRGVNDSADTLAELFSGLYGLGIDPYYLFQGDLARGTAHFRVPLSRGLSIYRELAQRLSGLELPRYAVDAPGGGGKVILPEGIFGREGDWWILKTRSGALARYPEEPEEPEEHQDGYSHSIVAGGLEETS